MSKAADLQASPATISTEALGLGRDFVRRVERQADQCTEFIHTLWAAIDARYEKFPYRKMRPDVWQTFAHRWEREAPAAFRLGFEADVKGRRGSVREWRLVSFRSSSPDEPDWQGEERGVAIMTHRAVADARSTRLEHPSLLAFFSLHALARRFERGRGRDDPALLADMAVVLRHDLSNVAPGQGFELVHPTEDFGWRGHVSLMRVDEAQHKLLMVRTFF